MDEQEIFNQIRELQKQRTSLKEEDITLVSKINELRDKLNLKSIKKGYYTDKGYVFCRVYDIKDISIFVYELDTAELYLSREVYSYEAFRKAYCECTKKEYDRALDCMIKRFKD